jgi:hypothetical protein
MTEQRNWLLEKIPKNCWVVNLDQDEAFGDITKWELRKFIESVVIEEHEVPVVLGLRFYNLIQDPRHHFENPICINGTKVFYNDRNLHFVGGYHAVVTYDERPEFVIIDTPERFGILHYAWLNPDRKKNVAKDIASGKRDYQKEDVDFEKRGVYPLHII